jgi:FAD/FMN-containing dehydrogenase
LSSWPRSAPRSGLPFAGTPDWSVLVELGLPAALEPEPTMAALFEAAVAAGLVSDGVIATSAAQAKRPAGPCARRSPRRTAGSARYQATTSRCRLSAIPGFIAEAAAARRRPWPVSGECLWPPGRWQPALQRLPGQSGDKRQDHEAMRETVKQLVHDMVHEQGGSVSAEHGVGRLKVVDLERYGDPVKLAAMRAVKAALDPAGILNPGAVLRGDGG